MNCPSCNIVCIEGSNYCHICGFSLKSYNVSPQSNGSLSQALKRLMPASYVEKLLASNGKSEGERRVVTILFSDVKGSTAMGEHLDPEDVLTIMNNAFAVLIEPIMRYEGTLARLMGDAILAFFGAPIAHEDDPLRACRAALDIVEGINKFSRKLEKEKGIKGFSVRVGINTGLVVVAEVGADLRVEYTAMGDAVNVASRMETSAEPGTILITEDTKKLLRGNFELLPIGPIQVKGRTTPVNSYRVLSELQSTDLKMYPQESPLCGRASEIQSLVEIVTKLKDKNGKIISVIGPCGIGKTRLISELRKHTSNVNYWVEVKSLAYQQNNSYWLIKTLLKNYLVKESSSTGEDISKCLLNRIQNKCRNSSYIYSFLSYLLDIEPEDHLPLQYDMTDAESLKGQIHYSVKEYLKFCCMENRLILLFEDLQWSDSASLDLLRDIFSLVTEYPLLIIMTYRNNEGEVWNVHSEYLLNTYLKQYQVICLNPLDQNESAELLNSLASEIFLSDKLKSDILNKSEGNPFFIEEIIKSLQERETTGNKSKITDEYLGTGNLLQGVIMSRLDNLSSVDKMVLQCASVCGRAFSKKILKNIIAETIGEQNTELSLTQLLKKEFLLPLQEENDEEFIFRQSLIQEVAYNSLLISSREKIHLSIGELLELNPNEATSETLAFHFEKGKSFKRSAGYYLKAADKAKEMFANKQALDFYGRILKLSKEIHLENQLLQKVYESCGDIYSLISEYPKALENFEKSLEIVGSDLIKGRIYQKCGHLFEKWGLYKKAIESYDLSLTFIINTGEIALEAGSYIGKGMVFFREGILSDAITFTEKALNLLAGSDYSRELSKCYNNLGIIFGKSGHLESAVEYLQKALYIRTETGNISGLSASYNNLGFCFQQQEKYGEAIENYSNSLDYCEKTGNVHAMAKIYDNLSNIYIAQGENDKAIEYNLKAMEILGKISLKDKDINQHLWLQSGVW